MLFGTVNPSGRLPYTLYPDQYVNQARPPTAPRCAAAGACMHAPQSAIALAPQISMFDMGMRPNASTGNPGRTYRFYTGVPVYPYGTGSPMRASAAARLVTSSAPGSARAGLSYTTFAYQSNGSDISVPFDRIQAYAAKTITSYIRRATDYQPVVIAVTVTNNGSVDGGDAVLAFMKVRGRASRRPAPLHAA